MKVLVLSQRPDGGEKYEYFCTRCGAPVTREKPGRRIDETDEDSEVEHVAESDCMPRETR